MSTETHLTEPETFQDLARMQIAEKINRQMELLDYGFSRVVRDSGVHELTLSRIRQGKEYHISQLIQVLRALDLKIVIG